MAWTGVVTNAGQALLDSFAQGGHTLTLTGATVGSGTVAEANLRVQTAISNEKDDASIISATTVTGGVKYKIQVGPASASVGAYTAHQIGIWAKLDSGSATLLAIAQSTDGVSIPASSASPNFAFALFIALAVDNTDDLSVTIDESAYVTNGTMAAALALKVDVGAIADEAVNTITEQSDNYPALTAGDKLSVIVGKVQKWLSGLKSKLDGIESGAQVNSITGVKGNAESNYRTGNVNVTPANVGAVDKTGDEMTGDLTLPHLNVQSGGRYTNIHLRDSNGVPRGMMWGDGESGRIFFRSINPSVAGADVGSIYTEYFLYQSTLTSGSASYKIYTERDTIPVDHGGTGATGSKGAGENLGLSIDLNGADWTRATMYSKMSKVPVPGSAFLWLSPTSAGLLSGNAISAYCTCIASTTGSGSWRFLAFTIDSNGNANVYTWVINGWTSASATPTIGAIRRVAVPQTQDVTATTDSNGNISLGLAAASYHVLSAKSSSRIVTPWVSGDNNKWYARVTGINGNASASVSVTVTVIYTLV